MIKKVSGGYKVVSEKKGKNLGGPYKTKKEAEKKTKTSRILQAQQRLGEILKLSDQEGRPKSL
ncbi:MAG: hypothetical protein ABSH13_16955 [Candidatus Acidiferrum sp.]|jgi:hypothetical protein